MQATKTKFHEALPHSAIKEVFEGVYIVMGTYIATYGEEQWQFSRNMTIVKEGNELTLINAIRLDDAGLAALERLGDIKNIIKLGAAHGIDNAFYADRYRASIWALPGDEHEDGLPITETLSPDHLPFIDTALYVFHSSKPEAILEIKRNGGIIVSCDSIKNWSFADEFFSKESAEKMGQYGMLRPVDIDRNWVASCSISHSDFEGLLSLEFQHLIPGHGQIVQGTAHEKVKDAVADVFA